MTLGLSTSTELKDGTWWIDEIGCAHSAVNVDESFDSLFLRHLGHIKLIVRRSEISVTWDVALVSEESVSAVIGYLRGGGIAKGRLRFFYFGWAEEEVAGGAETAQRIEAVQRFRSVSQMPSTYVEVRANEQMSEAPAGIRNVFELWRRTGGQLSAASQDECADLLPQILLYRPDRKTGNLVFSWVGSGSLSTRIHGKNWSRQAIRNQSSNVVGSETSDYVDRISSAYRDVWETGEPHYACIQTLLSPARDAEPMWLTYHRLLLRYRLHDGKPALMCLSKRASALSKLRAAAP